MIRGVEGTDEYEEGFLQRFQSDAMRGLMS